MPTISECKPYISTIISDVSNILTENKINFSSNKKNTEIIAKDTDKNTVESILYGKLNIPKMILFCLLDIEESKNKVYVRQKVG